jgi:hypothetical protein
LCADPADFSPARNPHEGRREGSLVKSAVLGDVLAADRSRWPTQLRSSCSIGTRVAAGMRGHEIDEVHQGARPDRALGTYLVQHTEHLNPGCPMSFRHSAAILMWRTTTPREAATGQRSETVCGWPDFPRTDDVQSEPSQYRSKRPNTGS